MEGYKPSRMHRFLYFIFGRKVWWLYNRRDDLGRYLFKKFGTKFVWLDYLIRRNKIASHIEIYDAKRNIVIIDGWACKFYRGADHYLSICIS